MPGPSGRAGGAEARAAIFEHVQQGLVQSAPGRPAELGAQPAEIADQDRQIAGAEAAGIAPRRRSRAG